MPKQAKPISQTLNMVVSVCWGNQVFESTDPTQAWDGTFQNQGEPVNPGTFSYVLWYASGQYQSEEISGIVSVVR